MSAPVWPHAVPPYRDGVPPRSDTPAVLRRRATAVVVVAAALLITLTAAMVAARAQVRAIGDAAAPQAATAADLYFALSDLDAQVARMVLIGGDDARAGSRIDALGTYDRRSEQVDADLRRVLGVAGPADEAVVRRLLDGLAVYRQRVGQALTAAARPDAQGAYTQATNVLHLELLPAAAELRDRSEERLGDAYATGLRTEIAGVTVAVLLGGALLVLLVRLQVFLTRTFRRLVNPALLAATVAVLGLAAGAATVLVAQGECLRAARAESLSPFLALSRARAVSYDAAADTGRALLGADPDHYDREFARKSALLTGDRDGLAALSGSAEVAERWLGYRRDHQRIVALAGAGRRAEAVAGLTGLRRGDAAFDFYAFDTAVSAVAARHDRDFGREVARAGRLLRGWTVIPAAAAGLVILLAPLGVRARLAEYR
ncbi:hypothetical protein Asp14428_77000 [Actinoplanes sp. NBRC 14428]|nr:hypothetical protein Asp14428_77000 [Actinoplanes sp. NBRC 14428]